MTTSNAQEPIRNIIVAIAMEAESKPFIEHLNLTPREGLFPPQAPFLAYSGAYPGYDDSVITVITNGKDNVYMTGVDNCGTVPASLATFLALQQLPTTQVLINAGTAGGFRRKGAEIGDVFITTAVAHHDRRIPIPPFVPYGIGRLETTVHPHHHAVAEHHKFKLGICTTGNSLDKTDEDDKHMLANDAAVKDMEAAAIAWSCNLFKVPFMGVKVVTDIVDGDIATQEEFMANLDAASKSLQEAIPKVIEFLLAKESL